MIGAPTASLGITTILIDSLLVQVLFHYANRDEPASILLADATGVLDTEGWAFINVEKVLLNYRR